jgi:hypothetical protein
MLKDEKIKRIVDLMFELDDFFEHPVGFGCVENAPKEMSIIFNDREFCNLVSQEVARRKLLEKTECPSCGQKNVPVQEISDWGACSICRDHAEQKAFDFLPEQGWWEDHRD